MDNKVKKNFYFNIILVVFNASFPLLTAPYVSRVLGANNLGMINYMMSVTAFFVILASIGIPIYGIRTIAKYRHNDKLLSEHTTSIIIVNIIFAFATLMIFMILFSVISDDIPFKYWIIYVISFSLSFLNFEWFFVGQEDFKYITIRSVLIKLVTLLLIFIFVTNKNDYLIYGVLLISSQIITYIMNFVKSLHYWKPIISKNLIFYTFKATKYFYFTLLLASSFTIFDKVLVGLFLDNSSMALYFRNKQITMLGVGITTSLVKVLTPKMSKLIHEKKIEEYKILVTDSLEIYIMFSFPLMIGVITMSSELLYFFGGNEYLSGSNSLVILSIWMLIAGMNVFIDNQISIPNHMERITTVSSLFISIITVTVSILLTPRYGIVGASIALLLGEIVGLFIQFNLTNKKGYYDYKLISLDNLKVIISTVIMIIYILILKEIEIMNFYIHFGVIITTSIILYATVLLFLRSKHLLKILIRN